MVTFFLSLLSFNSFANPIGIIKQVECNKSTGFGVVEVHTNVNNVLISTWYNVKSTNLCSDSINSNLFLGKSSKLSNIGANNINNSNFILSEIILDKEGFIVDIKDSGNIHSKTFLKDIESSKRVNVQEAHNWYFLNKS
jgi:hypothetical protein